MRDRHWSEEVWPPEPYGHGAPPQSIDGPPRRSESWAHERLQSECATAAERHEAEQVLAYYAITRPDPWEPE